MTMHLVERPATMADTVRVTAGPFHTFSRIAEFQTTVARLQGVSGARIQSAQRGVLVLDVDYDGLVPLHVRLRELRDARWMQVQAVEDAVEIAVA